MTRKLVLQSFVLLVAVLLGMLIWSRPAQSPGVDTGDDDVQAVKEAILRARRIQLEAEYTFDTSQFANIYINDPRGGELTQEALARIQKIRQDPTLRMDQVGLLDYKKAAIENLENHYEDYMAGLRAKQAAGTLDAGEQLILEGETNGWPSPEPASESGAAQPALPCEYTTPAGETAYPPPAPLPCGPTPTPAPDLLPIGVPYRGTDPATLPAEAFEVDFQSIAVEGELARVVARIGPVTTEYVLVRVGGQWYIAGTKLVKAEP